MTFASAAAAAAAASAATWALLMLTCALWPLRSTVTVTSLALLTALYGVLAVIELWVIARFVRRGTDPPEPAPRPDQPAPPDQSAQPDRPRQRDRESTSDDDVLKLAY